MKICPLCKNKSWPSSAVLKSPVVNLGGKINLNSGSIRRYVCLNCNRVFDTSETVLASAEATENQLKIAARLTDQQIELLKERLDVTREQVELFDIEELYGQAA